MMLIAGWLLLLLGVLWAVMGLAASFRGRGRGFLLLYWDSVALVGTELTFPLVALMAVSTSVLLLLGAASTSVGRAGLWLSAAAALMMAITFLRAFGDRRVMQRALDDGLGDAGQYRIPPERAAWIDRATDWRRLLRPINYDTYGITTRRDLAYGPHGRFNTLDVLAPAERGTAPLPVLLHLHGGGLMIGEKNNEALPLLLHIARAGWIVVTINYRLAPTSKYPAQLEDTKRAIAWIREHAKELGADASFIAATGGSAGATLAALAALTANDQRYQPGFEAADTSVQAAVPFYGSYDLVSAGALPHLEAHVFPRSRAEDPQLWRDASASCLVRRDAPPFLIFHGSHDALAPVEDARAFAAALRAASAAPAIYAEQSGAKHGFDGQYSLRAEAAVAATHRFLESVYAKSRASVAAA
ncbi:alpha/beta hydrolase [Roseateles violae]|uniref:Alpha/beta hydrolase n=1 Tax=Roseateles violae TaxID=3058042 RepID=A0ABT8E037_9BURK|nr:alpha/beta hydrolase [Pelomonas sp. PFR6]MDN3923205.1 alpha/beta hydrolase [Pelomonas sp. PFR6]